MIPVVGFTCCWCIAAPRPGQGYSREEWNQLREKGASNGWLVDPEKVRDSSSSALDLDRTICRAQSNVTGGSLRSQTLLLRGALSSVGREDGPVRRTVSTRVAIHLHLTVAG